jgi:hypothetical protein
MIVPGPLGRGQISIASLSLDGVMLPAGPIPMTRDAGTHRVKIVLGEKAASS